MNVHRLYGRDLLVANQHLTEIVTALGEVSLEWASRHSLVTVPVGLNICRGSGPFSVDSLVKALRSEGVGSLLATTWTQLSGKASVGSGSMFDEPEHRPSSISNAIFDIALDNDCLVAVLSDILFQLDTILIDASNRFALVEHTDFEYTLLSGYGHTVEAILGMPIRQAWQNWIAFVPDVRDNISSQQLDRITKLYSLGDR